MSSYYQVQSVHSLSPHFGALAISASHLRGIVSPLISDSVNPVDSTGKFANRIVGWLVVDGCRLRHESLLERGRPSLPRNSPLVAHRMSRVSLHRFAHFCTSVRKR